VFEVWLGLLFAWLLITMEIISALLRWSLASSGFAFLATMNLINRMQRSHSRTSPTRNGTA